MFFHLSPPLAGELIVVLIYFDRLCNNQVMSLYELFQVFLGDMLRIPFALVLQDNDHVFQLMQNHRLSNQT